MLGLEVMLFPSLASWLPTLLFVVLGLPLVWQDSKDNSVSLGLLVGVFLAWSAISLLTTGSAARLFAALIVLVAGSLLLMILPGRLGEADVVFMSGMALLLPFWSLLLAIVLGCVAGLAAFVWFSRGDRGEFLSQPLPLLPSLYWGGLTIILGGIRI